MHESYSLLQQHLATITEFLQFTSHVSLDGFCESSSLIEAEQFPKAALLQIQWCLIELVASTVQLTCQKCSLWEVVPCNQDKVSKNTTRLAKEGITSTKRIMFELKLWLICLRHI
jgi:hypothetical protein